MTNTEHLLQLKNKIGQMEKEKEQLKGELAAHLKLLKESFGCDTLEEAEELLAQNKKEAVALEKKLAEAVERVESLLSECEEDD